MKDILTTVDLEFWTRIGLTLEERSTEQRLLITVEIPIGKKFIDYADVTQDIKKLSHTEHETIEQLAEDAAQMILRKYSKEITVTVKKSAIPGARLASITITRKRAA